MDGGKVEVDKASQQQVEVELIADTIMMGGGFIHKKTTPTIKVAKWLADNMVNQKVAKIKGVK